MGKNEKELHALANWLSENQDSILKKWGKRIREAEEKPTQLADMSRKEFQNDVPIFLERLVGSLKGKDKSFVDIAKEHGEQRWNQGFELSLAVKEWGLLQEVIQNEITSFMKKQGLSSHSLNKAHNILAIHIQEGIKFSIQKFDQLQQEESEAKLQDLEQTLRKPEDLTRKNNLRSASHDLKGIMYSLQLGFQLLQNEKLSPKVSELIDQMTKGADSLEQLLNDLLDLFRLETKREKINLSEFDTAEMLAGLCESMQPMAKTERLELKYEGAESLPVKSDKKKVERIARNLLLNALKYTKEGHVKVRCERNSDESWLLEISDTGPGLEATHARSLTSDTASSLARERAEVADSNKDKRAAQIHGEGIGLLIVRHLCKLLDAAIEVDTRLGKGTTFQIVFPLELSK